MIDPELLLQGYRLGVFPMAMEDGAIEWFSPDPRAILPLEDFHVPHALRRLLRKKAFETKIDNRWSNICVLGNSRCSIRNGLRRICNNSAASRFHGITICDF